MMRISQSTLLATLLLSLLVCLANSQSTNKSDVGSAVNGTAGASTENGLASGFEVAAKPQVSRRALLMKIEDWFPKIKEVAKHLIELLQEVIGDLKECLKEGHKSCSIETCLKKIAEGLKDCIKMLTGDISSKRPKYDNLGGTIDGVHNVIKNFGDMVTGGMMRKKPEVPKETEPTEEKYKSKTKGRSIEHI